MSLNCVELFTLKAVNMHWSKVNKDCLGHYECVSLIFGIKICKTGNYEVGYDNDILNCQVDLFQTRPRILVHNS